MHPTPDFWEITHGITRRTKAHSVNIVNLGISRVEINKMLQSHDALLLQNLLSISETHDHSVMLSNNQKQ